MKNVIVHTNEYTRSHTHLPRQPRDQRIARWAFHIDKQDTPVFFTASYTDALAQAAKLATFSVTVLP